MTEITIRRAKMADIPALDTLLYQVHAVHSNARPDLFASGAKKYTDDELTRILEQPEERPIFVAVRDNTVVGYAFCIREDFTTQGNMTPHMTLYIDDLCVDEEERGHHIGTALYDFVCEYAREYGFYNVTLNAWAANPQALHFYEKLGMQIYKYGMEQIL